LKDYNVSEHGKVGHQELTEAFHASSIWAYPCTHPETFCITALRAQSAGAIPVVIKHSGLCEVVKGGESCAHAHEYLTTLQNTMRSIEKYSLKDRRELSNTINDKSQWQNVAQLWQKIINNL